MTVTPELARETAIAHIERYVLRGDSYESLKAGQHGSYSPGGNCANIGSYGTYECRAPRAMGPDCITVSQVDGVACCYHFSLRRLYDEIESGTKQLSLFGAAS